MHPARERYFDNAATTPTDPRVVAEMLPFLSEQWGNPSSIHASGRRARAAVELARERVAALVGAEDPSEITFTSGASEANNWVLSHYQSGVIGPFEHPSVREIAAKRGFGVLAHEGMRLQGPAEKAEIVSVMAVQNEFGACFDLSNLREWGVATHSDITQALGKIPFDLAPLDFASFSGHKMYAPMGIGALYRRGDVSLAPLIEGGGQERGQRAGTLNVPGIVALGAASAIAADQRESDFAHANHLRDLLLDELRGVPDCRPLLNERQSPFVLAIQFYGVEGETLVLDLDRRGFAASAGSACASGHAEPWPSLVELGVSPDWARGAIRISAGRYNTADSAKALAAALTDSVEALRRLR